MKFRLRVSEAAVADVDETALFIAQDSLNAAFDVLRVLHGARDIPAILSHEMADG